VRTFSGLRRSSTSELVCCPSKPCKRTHMRGSSTQCILITTPSHPLYWVLLTSPWTSTNPKASYCTNPKAFYCRGLTSLSACTSLEVVPLLVFQQPVVGRCLPSDDGKLPFLRSRCRSTDYGGPATVLIFFYKNIYRHTHTHTHTHVVRHGGIAFPCVSRRRGPHTHVNKNKKRQFFLFLLMK